MIIPRPSYGHWLDEFRNKKVIKVLTGLRRAGKSTILELYIQKLLNEGSRFHDSGEQWSNRVHSSCHFGR